MPAGSLGERVEAIFGAGLQQELLPLDERSDGLEVHGFIAKPTFHRATRRQQFLFVNGRVVQSRPVGHALYEAYRTLLPRDRHPVSFLFVTLPGSDIDVNVHPAKLEVRFREEARLYDYLRRLFRQRLQESLATPVPQAAGNALPGTPPPDAIARGRVPMMWQAAPVDRPAAIEPDDGLDPSPPGGRSLPADTGQELRLYAGYPEANRVLLEGDAGGPAARHLHFAAIPGRHDVRRSTRGSRTGRLRAPARADARGPRGLAAPAVSGHPRPGRRRPALGGELFAAAAIAWLRAGAFRGQHLSVARRAGGARRPGLFQRRDGRYRDPAFTRRGRGIRRGPAAALPSPADGDGVPRRHSRPSAPAERRNGGHHA